MYNEIRQPQIYVTNKELLHAIHLSKMTYCSYVNESDTWQDIIVHDVADITAELLQEAKESKAHILTQEAKAEARANGAKIPKDSTEYDVDPNSFSDEDIVIRVMNGDHVPLDATRKRKVKDGTVARKRTNFLPFKHYRVINGVPVEVLRSHWNGTLADGHFDMEFGHTTDELAKLYSLLVERYSRRFNWRNYCVDTETEALTDAGWVDINAINESQRILSYDQESGNLVWSKIKSIYRGEYSGLMHKLTCQGLDALITPNHKMMTERGLVKAEDLLEDDVMILMGKNITDHDMPEPFKVKVSDIDFHGGFESGNVKPTTQYDGMVWCPETEYGCFIARRNGNVYLTGNTYLDEMKTLTLLQLSQEGLQFNEAVGSNPFAFYTTVATNSFTKIFNIEKRNQNIRDELMSMTGAAPSFTKQVDIEFARESSKPSEVTQLYITPERVKEVEQIEYNKEHNLMPRRR